MSFNFNKVVGNRNNVEGISKETLYKLSCKICPLKNMPKFEYYGNEDSDILFLVEKPVKQESDSGRILTDAPGIFIKKTIGEVYSELSYFIPKTKYVDFVDENFRFASVIKSLTPRNRPPTEVEIECCRHFLEEEILKNRPKVVVGFGDAALQWMIGSKGVSYRRCRPIPRKVGDHVFWFLPTYNVFHIYKNVEEKNEDIEEYYAFKNDIKKAFELIKKEPLFVEEDQVFDNIEIFTGKNHEKEIERIKQLFQEFENTGIVGLDIETSSDDELKERMLVPFSKNATILTIAISNFDKTASITLNHKESKWTDEERKQVENLVVGLLTNPKIEKIAHNISFELLWFFHFYPEVLKNIYKSVWHDTQAQEYVIHGTSNNSESAKMQSLNNLCLHYMGLDLKAVSRVERTRLADTKLQTVLLYNGADAKFTYMLYLLQNEKIDELKMHDVYRSQVDRTITTTIMTFLGISVDFDAVEDLYKEYSNRMQQLFDEMLQAQEVKAFEKRFKQPFNPNSSDHCIKLFNGIMRRPEVITENGKISTSKEVLETIDHPLAQNLIKYRETAKIISTYIEGVRKDGKYVFDDGKIHPKFTTTFTATRRLSSQNPNIQNYPKRKNVEIRRTLRAQEGNYLVAIDYGQIEARVVAMASRDRNLVKKLKEKYDIHAHWAREILKIYPEFRDKVIKEIGTNDEEKVFKRVRYHAKNKLVFPALFGSSPYSIAMNLQMPNDKAEILFKKFWGEFGEVHKWHEKMRKEYKTKGYVELLTGFRRYIPFGRKNAVINTPIQGTAFDLVSSAMEALSKIAIETGKLYLHPIINVHDELIFEIPEDKMVESVELIIKEMCRPRFSFINVPIVVEASYGKNLFQLEDIGEFSSEDFGFL